MFFPSRSFLFQSVCVQWRDVPHKARGAHRSGVTAGLLHSSAQIDSFVLPVLIALFCPGDLFGESKLIRASCLHLFLSCCAMCQSFTAHWEICKQSPLALRQLRAAIGQLGELGKTAALTWARPVVLCSLSASHGTGSTCHSALRRDHTVAAKITEGIFSMDWFGACCIACAVKKSWNFWHWASDDMGSWIVKIRGWYGFFFPQFS